MTQRTWKTEDGFDVLTGWDRPLRRFFLVIDRLCQTCGGDGCAPPLYPTTEANGNCPTCGGTGEEKLFSNITAVKYPRGDMTLREVKAEVEDLLTSCPTGLWHDLTLDCTNDQGNNHETYYGVCGRVKEKARS
jgi:hypothetical protein